MQDISGNVPCFCKECSGAFCHGHATVSAAFTVKDIAVFFVFLSSDTYRLSFFSRTEGRTWRPALK
jgi:hypothetical protein